MTYTYKLSRRLASAHDVQRDARRIALLLLLLLAAACGGGDLIAPLGSTPHAPDPAAPGWLNLSLSTPGASIGAVQVTLSGAPIDSLQFYGGTGFASIHDGAGHLLVTGTVMNGVVARMWVPDTRRWTRYVATVDQAAVRGTYQLEDVTHGYAVQVTR